MKFIQETAILFDIRFKNSICKQKVNEEKRSIGGKNKKWRKSKN